MECKFVVGQKVVCIVPEGTWIEDATGRTSSDLTNPVGGRIYTIVSIEAFGHLGIFLSLAETGNHHRFRHTGFAPVDERKTDISVLEALLTPAGQKKVLAGYNHDAA